MSKNTNIADLINYISVDGSGNVVLTTGGQVATQSYVTTAVSNLVNAAPSTLDTLNELAAALGNDANFSTTVTTSIATKQAQLNGTGFVKVSGTTVSYDNSTYLTTTSASSNYLPYTGATTNVNLGVYNLTANQVIAGGAGVNNVATFTTYDGGIATQLIGSTGNLKFFPFWNPSIGARINAENSAGSAYIPLSFYATAIYLNSPTTLTGALSGTSATFSSSVTATGLSLTTSGSTGATFTSSGTNVYTSLSFFNTTTNYGYDIGFGGSASIAPNSFYVYGGSTASVKLLINPSGNVGIGTSSPTSNYGFEKNLTIASANNAELQLSQTANSHFLSIGITNGFNFFQTTAGQGYVYYIGGTERMRIASTGAATFSSSVTANGIMSLGNDGTYGSTYKTLGLTGNTDGTHRIFAGTADNMYIAAATARGINFWTNGGASPKMIITSFGNVGVGTDTPRTAATGGNKTLDIKGGIYFGSTGSESTCINNDDSMIFNIDANNDNSSNFFRWATNTTQETGGNELMRLSESGLLQLNSTNSTGIRFAAGGSNLNYYEEGNWTPQLVFDSGTYVMGGINSGRYVRVGNLVHLQFQMQWSSINGSAGGTLRVNGVPFSAGGTSRSAGAICANNSIILGSGYTWLGLTIDPGASFIYIIQNAQSGGYSHGPSVNSSGIVYSLTITYSII